MKEHIDPVIAAKDAEIADLRKQLREYISHAEGMYAESWGEARGLEVAVMQKDAEIAALKAKLCAKVVASVEHIVSEIRGAVDDLDSAAEPLRMQQGVFAHLQRLRNAVAEMYVDIIGDEQLEAAPRRMIAERDEWKRKAEAAEAQVAELEADIQRRESEEASVCPEDVGVVEYVTALKAQLATAREDTRKLANEASGFMSLVPVEITGYTNQKCLRYRIDAAREKGDKTS